MSKNDVSTDPARPDGCRHTHTHERMKYHHQPIYTLSRAFQMSVISAVIFALSISIDVYEPHPSKIRTSQGHATQP